MAELTLEEGTLLVRYARLAVDRYLSRGVYIMVPQGLPRKLYERRGVFVSLEKIVSERGGVKRRVLRGRRGMVDPVLPLIEATIRSAIEVAVRDYRYPPLNIGELNSIVFEVTIVSDLEPLDTRDIEKCLSQLKLGLEGVVLEVGGRYRSVVLPQTAVEEDWDKSEMLQQVCLRAGLPMNAWRDSNVRIYKFKTQIFYELHPNGEVIERALYLGRE